MIGKENAVEEKYERKSVSQMRRDRAIRRTDERLGTGGKLRIVKIIRQGEEKLPLRRGMKVHVWTWEGRWTEPYKKKKNPEETRAPDAETGDGVEDGVDSEKTLGYAKPDGGGCYCWGC
jgi:hypothetical protein